MGTSFAGAQIYAIYKLVNYYLQKCQELALAVSKRIRRTPEEARRVILDAAEQVMSRSGPGGLRLQEVAEAAGVSHPAILHHFESRDGLIKALNLRTIDELGEAVRAQMEASGGGGEAVRAAFAAYRGGLAQRVIWVLQSGGFSADQQAGPRLVDELAGRLHALRCRLAKPGEAPDPADSRAVVHLITVAGLGDALVGGRLRHAGDAAAEARQAAQFEDWLAALIHRHVVGG
jgi:AcrR family transcriptional regulator